MSGNKGSKSHWWRGGITPLGQIIKGIAESKQWREAIFKRDNYTCQDCDKRGGKLHSRHKKAFSKIFREFLQEYNQFSPIEDKEILLRLATKYEPFWEVNNGITLCVDCHREYHKRGGKMKCSACVFARVEKSGLNFQVGEGEVRILGCKEHIGRLLEMFRLGVVEEKKQKAIVEVEKKNEEYAGGETTTPDPTLGETGDDPNAPTSTGEGV